eukprot:jgi/Ulvmu1/9933/UM058_0016.1
MPAVPEQEEARTDVAPDLLNGAPGDADDMEVPLLENSEQESDAEARRTARTSFWRGRPMAIGVVVLLIISGIQLLLAFRFRNAVMHVFPILAINAMPGVLFSCWYILEATCGPTRHGVLINVVNVLLAAMGVNAACFMGYFFLWATMQDARVQYLPWTTLGGFLAFFNLSTAEIVTLWLLFKHAMTALDLTLEANLPRQPELPTGLA